MNKSPREGQREEREGAARPEQLVEGSPEEADAPASPEQPVPRPAQRFRGHGDGMEGHSEARWRVARAGRSPPRVGPPGQRSRGPGGSGKTRYQFFFSPLVLLVEFVS